MPRPSASVFVLALLAMGIGAAEAHSGKVKFTVDEGTNFAAAMSPDGGRMAIDLQGDLFLLSGKGGKAIRVKGLVNEARLPSWSPDGKQVAFQHYFDGQWRIFTMRADGTGLKQITFGTWDDREPTWSPDGQSIIFSSDRAGNYDIWKVAAGGSPPLQLTTGKEDEYYPSMAPNGNDIAFVADGESGRLLQLRQADGAIRTIVKGVGELALPNWKPDGRALAYVDYLSARPLQRDGVTTLNVVDIATQSVSAVTAAGEDVFAGRAQWLGNGDLLYTADGKIKRAGANGVAIVPFKADFTVMPAGNYKRKAYDFSSRAPRQVKGILHPVVSPDGRQIAFSALSDLWLLTIGNPDPVRLTHDASMDIAPAWSPDGKTLAFMSDRRGTGTMDLFLRDMETGQERRVTDTSESLGLPVFSPDGTKIALLMLSTMDWHATTPYVLDLKSGELKKIHVVRPGQPDWLFQPGKPSWSRDGKTISYVVMSPSSKRFRQGNNEILHVPLDGGTASFVTPTPGKSLGVRTANGAPLSPDGRHMAFVQDGVLWTVETDPAGAFAAAPRRMTNDLADAPSWSGDSKSIVYISADKLKKIHLDDARVEDVPMALAWQPAIPSGRKVIHAGRLFDGRALTYRQNVDIVIDDNKITSVVPHKNDWPGAQLIDASEKTVIPGLFENHIHNLPINGELTGRIALAYGITSIREPGADPSEGLEAKESWGSGARAGPRLFTTGLIEASRLFYQISLPVGSKAGLELEIERAARLDYDLVKTYERLDSGYHKRIVEAAHKLGIPVTSHDLYPAVAFGGDAVEHIGTIGRMGVSDRASMQGKIYDDVMQLYTRSHMAIVPTTIGGSPSAAAYFLEREGRAFRDIKQLKLLAPRVLASPYVKGAIDGSGSKLDPVQLVHATWPLTHLKRAGISMPPGTDTSFFNLGLGIVTELQFYVDAGYSPAEALREATLASARLNHVEASLGSIEPGKFADMVVVDGDPLTHLMDVLNVQVVIKDGRVFRFDQLTTAAASAAR